MPASYPGFDPTPYDVGVTDDPDLTWTALGAQMRYQVEREAAAELDADFPEITEWM